MNVTGFSLIFLCHKFSRRGARFLQSLWNQDETCPPLLLTGFYADDADAAALLLAKGPHSSRHRLELFQADPERVMERSVLFSMIEPPEHISHAVFTDCDLWFPPDFWGSYAIALRQKSFGYWGSYVLHIPYDEAEVLLKMESPGEEEYHKRVQEIRYPKQQGGVGHFQCVPRELCKYPAHRFASVSKVDDAFAQWAIGKSVDKIPERRLESRAAYHLGHPYSWEGTNIPL